MLEPGTRIGAYEVLCPLGAGGMGEVYRARDERLDREVAIKVLPPAFLDDPARLARFEREARVLASLNHPNVASIYGLELGAPAPGTGTELRALVLELVEGAPLSAGIGRGLALRQALGIARQVAEALDAAHEKGIIHRDLKPGNVMLTAGGVVKVLDFGLAKRTERTAGDLSRSPTLSVAATGDGVVLGTAAYMSPEQARGQEVDKRTDLWALGCVLYEMLTGVRAFGGATMTDTLAAILEREPDWQRLPETTPTAVRRLLSRCLSKSLKTRSRDAGDVMLDLEAAIADLDQPVVAALPSPPTGRSRVGWRIAAGAALVAAGVVATLTWRLWASEVPAPVLGPISRLTFGAGLATEPSLSADGRLLAYASNRGGEGNLDIYVQQTTGGAAIRLTDDVADDRSPDVSPDGSLIAFRSDRDPSGVYVTSALGGTAHLVAAEGRAPKFSPDGRAIAYWTGRWLASRGFGSVRHTFIVPTEGGTPRPVAADLPGAGDAVWAPDGASLVLLAHEDSPDRSAASRDWWWVPLDGGQPVRTHAFQRFESAGILIDNTDSLPYPLAWAEQGVLFSGETGNGDTRGLWLLVVDPRSGRVDGPPKPLTNGTTVDLAAAIAADGTMVFAGETRSELLFALPLESGTGRVTGPLRPIREDSTTSGRATVSEDGTLLVFPRYELTSGGLWVRNLRTGEERQLAATPRTPLNPVISADGLWVAYTVTRTETGGQTGPGEGYVVRTAGDAPRKVCDDCLVDLWTRDDAQLLVSEPGRAGLERIDLGSGERRPLVHSAGKATNRPLLGPSGSWITFNAGDGVYVVPVRDDRPAEPEEWTLVVPKRSNERSAGVSPDGRLLYMLLERDGFRCLYALPIDPDNGHARGEPFLVAHFHDPTRTWGSTGLGSAVAEGMFVADLIQETGDLWMTRLIEPPAR